MSPVYVHLLLNHIPILGSVFGLLILLYGIFSKNKSIINTALITFVLVSLFTIPVFLSGEPAEESVENIQGILKSAIESHEESAELAMWVMQSLGVLSLITWFMVKKENKIAGPLTYFTLLLSLITFGMMVKVGNEGGKIRHTEIDSVSPAQNNGTQDLKQDQETDED